MLGPEKFLAMLCFQARAGNLVRCCTLELREEQLFPFQSQHQQLPPTTMEESAPTLLQQPPPPPPHCRIIIMIHDEHHRRTSRRQPFFRPLTTDAKRRKWYRKWLLKQPRRLRGHCGWWPCFFCSVCCFSIRCHVVWPVTWCFFTAALRFQNSIFVQKFKS